MFGWFFDRFLFLGGSRFLDFWRGFFGAGGWILVDLGWFWVSLIHSDFGNEGLRVEF